MPPDQDRLPCRGCTADCPDYERCEGKPWRLREQLERALRWADLPTPGANDRNSGQSREV